MGSCAVIKELEAVRMSNLYQGLKWMPVPVCLCDCVSVNVIINYVTS